MPPFAGMYHLRDLEPRNRELKDENILPCGMRSCAALWNLSSVKSNAIDDVLLAAAKRAHEVIHSMMMVELRKRFA